MSLCGGKKKSKRELEEEAEEKAKAKCFSKDHIYIDAMGNFRYGDKKFDPEYELSVIVDKDDLVEEEGKIWYVISTGWMNAWLLYAHLNRGVNPNPGRIDNESLLDSNENFTAWIPKSGLEMARNKHEGDYRRISQAAWEALCKFYPGSGPAITTEFIPDEAHVTDGLYDCTGWKIEQKMYDELVRSKMSKKKLVFGGKNKSKAPVASSSDKTKEKETAGRGVEEVKEGGEVRNTSEMELQERSTGSASNEDNMKQFFGKSAVGSKKTAADKPAKKEDKGIKEETGRESTSWLFDD